jgi:drug/metabolite transporter (DMT)-like permease
VFKKNLSSEQINGVLIAFMTPMFLGVAPIFGKLAIHAGADSFTVAALRTVIAAALLWIIYGLFFRKFIYIYPAGLLGCIVVGAVNGVGSLFYYGGLGMIDASLAQLINGMYLVFAVFLTRLGGERISSRVALRTALALLALVMLTGLGGKPINWLGVGLMLANALMFAGTIILSQYVLYEMPPATATLYIVSTMAVVVVMVWAAVGRRVTADTAPAVIGPIFALAVTTALSRLSMFSGVKILGSLQTAIMAVGEIGVALALAFFVLGDRLTAPQWIGVAVLGSSLLLIRPSDFKAQVINPSALLIHDMASVQFQRIAFHRAFGTHEQDNEFGIMGKLTTAEMQSIQRMMGAKSGAVDPFPISKNSYYQPNDIAAFLDGAMDETRPAQRKKDTPDSTP